MDRISRPDTRGADEVVMVPPERSSPSVAIVIPRVRGCHSPTYGRRAVGVSKGTSRVPGLSGRRRGPKGVVRGTAGRGDWSGHDAERGGRDARPATGGPGAPPGDGRPRAVTGACGTRTASAGAGPAPRPQPG